MANNTRLENARDRLIALHNDLDKAIKQHKIDIDNSQAHLADVEARQQALTISIDVLEDEMKPKAAKAST